MTGENQLALGYYKGFPSVKSLTRQFQRNGWVKGLAIETTTKLEVCFFSTKMVRDPA